jgi:hypothetical protein
MNDDQWTKAASIMMFLALACGVSLLVSFTFVILAALNKCP